MDNKPRPKRKVIVSCAITGSIHTPSMSPHLPITPAEIAAEAIAASKAGAAIIHLHARNPENGRPTQDPAIYSQFLPRIKDGARAILNVTSGGAVNLTLEERLRPVAMFAPELASLNMGSMNFGLFPMLNRFHDFKHDWERPYLEGSRDVVFRNTFKDIAYILETCRGNGTRFECECYDISHLYNLAHFVEQRLIEPPLFVQSVFGLLGGIGGHPEDVIHMKRTADRLFGNEYVWSVLGAGRNQMSIASQSINLRGNVRVGLEDSLWSGPDRLARSNAEQVTTVRGIIESLACDIATPDEARRMLHLKGQDRVEF
jgi:uncharacterized protein (DUF849 family)